MPFNCPRVLAHVPWPLVFFSSKFLTAQISTQETGELRDVVKRLVPFEVDKMRRRTGGAYSEFCR